ncbi:Sec-independent protein translocase protein TatB [SAR92 clade bacterium H231]|jgi:sec-independent protein translocase protein TatB|nr:twin-arginine translocase subunit TatB [Porticoccaceae bacterium]MCT2531760.1 Sec-independent protein translocase protein TatB [SAR92 clade bacterium H231]MBT6319594.1 twin-arginine translocase subunit TatB [Porticoccaceae bacterium]MBT7259405.1 twin-arginine translocase subunit TatB [Porticoccaceae bacterium]MBT7904944.1 twin-arginine translocase subunit TatB [Porticoccaceae bacterium]
MFDVGFSELLVIAVITLIVMGPERLPETVRTISLWIGRLKQMMSSARRELESEVGMGEIHRQLHNEKILRDLENSKTKFEDSMRDSTAELKNTASEIKDKLDSSTVDKS